VGAGFGGEPGDLAVLEVEPAASGELGRRGGPDLGGRPGLGGLESRGRLGGRVAVLVDPAERDHLLAREVALQRRQDPAGVQRERADASVGRERVELHGEEDVGGLRLPVGRPLVVGLGAPVEVVEAHRRAVVPAGGHRHHPRVAAALDRRPQPVDQREVPEVVGGELGLPARPHPDLRGRHDPGVVDHHVDRAAGVQEVAGEGGDAVEVTEVEGGELDTLDPVERLLRRVRATGGDDDVGAGGGQGAGRLEAESRVAARDDREAAGEVDAVQHLAGGGRRAESGSDRGLCRGHVLDARTSSALERKLRPRAPPAAATGGRWPRRP
jgi:hypothetical protein